ncbi:MAG: thioredoxin [Bacteroidota bacterium]
MSTFDFEASVIAKSQDVPVVVDFWAPWCGPCQFLGPVIEELAAEANGKWELIKVNTDEHQELSQRFGIRGIPAVKMFYQGEVIADFTGALPKHQIVKWLEEYLPDERKNELALILQEISETNGELSTAKLENFVAQHPDLWEAKLRLAEVLIFDQAEQAQELVADIKLGNEFFDQAEDIRNLAALMEYASGDTSNLATFFEEAQQALQKRELDKALPKFIEIISIDKKFADELPRKGIIALFHLLGNQHELTKKYRRRFDMSLY